MKQRYLFAPFLFLGFPPQPLPDCPFPFPEPSFFGTPFDTFPPPKSFTSSMEHMFFHNLFGIGVYVYFILVSWLLAFLLFVIEGKLRALECW
jgi:hypothetical protein